MKHMLIDSLTLYSTEPAINERLAKN